MPGWGCSGTRTYLSPKLFHRWLAQSEVELRTFWLFIDIDIFICTIHSLCKPPNKKSPEVCAQPGLSNKATGSRLRQLLSHQLLRCPKNRSWCIYVNIAILGDLPLECPRLIHDVSFSVRNLREYPLSSTLRQTYWKRERYDLGSPICLFSFLFSTCKYSLATWPFHMLGCPQCYSLGPVDSKEVECKDWWPRVTPS